MMKQKHKSFFLRPQDLRGLLATLIIGLGSLLQAQTTMTGKVVDQNNEPILGVTVSVKDTNRGTQTDFDGNYSISVEQGETLVFSYVGFKTQEVLYSNQSTIDVTLPPDIDSLDEVVVIGYGERDRKDLIGAVSTVQAEGIAEQPISSFQEALSGQVSGVQLRGNGAPGSAPEVLIRGIASTNANNAPLYVVDGIPLGNNDSQRDNSVLASIDPNSIESISVLKDASAKAIYGSRASNGVIIIKTKRGKVGKPTITFGTKVGFASVPDFEQPDVLNAEQLRRFQIESLEDRRAFVGALGPGERAELDRLIGLGNLGAGTNWFDEITRDGSFTEYNVGVNGGSEQVRYNVNANYLDQEGTLLATDFKRYSMRANIDIDITDKIRFGVNLAPTQALATGISRTEAGGGNFDIFGAIPLSRWTDPSAPVRDENGDLTNVAPGDLITFYNVNPVYLLTGRDDDRRTNQLLGGTYLEVDIIEGLTARTFGSVEYIDSRDTSFTPSDFPGDRALEPNLSGTRQASAGITEGATLNTTWQNFLNYTTTIADDHEIIALAGLTFENRRFDGTGISANNLIDETIRIPSGSNTDPSNVNNFRGGGSASENSLLSLIGRLDYSYKNKYYVTGTIRRDGSSRFGSNNRYGNFPSIAAAWRVSNEAFWEPLQNTISEFKIEGGYGISGSNANIGNFQAQGQINAGPNYVFGGELAPGSAVSVLPNTNVGWEESRETNLGVDLGFLKNKIFLGVDYYNIESFDFLETLPLPTTSGFGGVITNLGRIQNRGVEVELNIDNILGGKDFQWDANLNFTHNKSKVLELTADAGFVRRGVIARAISETRVGEEVALYRGFNVTGLFTQAEIDDPNVPKYPGAVEGSLKYEDGNGDGVLGDEEDFVIIGNPNPDLILGMVHSFKYKDFDLRVVFDGAFGGQNFNGTNQYNGNQDGVFNVDTRQLERWRPGDDPNSRTIPGTASAASRQKFRLPNSLSVDDADYLWVRNITLGYRFDGKIVGNAFKNARVYASVQNPFVFTNFELGNPQVNRSADTALVRNVNYGSYPISTTATLGFNVTF